MLRIAATIATIGMGATVVYAQNLDAIKSRRDDCRFKAMPTVVTGDQSFNATRQRVVDE